MKKLIFALLTLIMALPLSAVPVLAAESPVLTSVIISPASPSVVVGGTKQLTVATLDELGAPITATTTFLSSDAAVASVDNTGLVTGLLAGPTMITATAVNGTTTVMGTTTVTVTEIPVLTSVTLNPASFSVGIGATQQITTLPIDQYGAPIVATTTFVSNNTSVATVNNAGLVTGLISGGTTITVTSVKGAATVIATSTVSVNVVPIKLLSAENFVILSKAGITNIPTSVIKGNVGTSPVTGASIAGLGCPEVTGTIYSVDATGPACRIIDSVLLTAAVSDMETAYTAAAGQTAGVGPFLNVGAGTVSGVTLAPGVYTFDTNVTIPTNITLAGGLNDVWVFQITGTLGVDSNVNVILSGGAQAKNIFWQVADVVTLGTNSHFVGTILARTKIALQTGATLDGRAMAQSEVTLDQNTVTIPPTSISAITGFNFSEGTGVINETNKTISVNVPNGTNVTALIPIIITSGSSTLPLSGVAQNFTSPVTYTVIATDGSTTNYIVTVTVLAANTTPPSNGGGGYVGTSYCSSVVYGEWKTPVGSLQYRDVVSLVPSLCSLTTSQQEARSRTTGDNTEPIVNPTTPNTPVVSGETNYSNGTLLKSDNNKIYVVIDNKLLYIPTLKELAKYKGQITKVSNLVITNFSNTNVIRETNYANGTLLKGDNNKIYVVIDNKLVYIPTLKELAKHKGQIIKVSNLVIINFASTNVLGKTKYADGTLVRANGDTKVYVIQDGKKVHIKTLTELKKYVTKILNIEISELANY